MYCSGQGFAQDLMGKFDSLRKQYEVEYVPQLRRQQEDRANKDEN